MANLITSGADTIAPTLILGYESTRAAGNVIHRIPGRPSPGVTFRPAQLRSGNMKLLFDSEADAADAETTLATAETCTLSSDERDSIEMTFVLSGRLDRSLDDETRSAWVVSFDWAEVSP